MQVLKKDDLVMIYESIIIKRGENRAYMNNFHVITKEDNLEAIKEYLFMVHRETGVTMTMENVCDRYVDTSIRKRKMKLATSEKEIVTQKLENKVLLGDAQKALRKEVEEVAAITVVLPNKTRS